MAGEINNYIEDDWNDNALNNRTSPEKGYYYNYHTGGTGDLLKGVYRPRWNNSQGTVSATSGYVSILPDGRFRSPSNMSVGTWIADFYAESGDNETGEFYPMAQGDTEDWRNGECWRLYGDGPNSQIVLRKFFSGTNSVVLNVSYPQTSQVWYTHQLDRDSYGNFEIFVDGSSKGTVNDTYLPPSIDEIGYYLANSSSNDARMDNLLVQ